MLTYSVKCIPFYFPPLGAIKRGDTNRLVRQKLLGNVAAEDSFQTHGS